MEKAHKAVFGRDNRAKHTADKLSAGLARRAKPAVVSTIVVKPAKPAPKRVLLRLDQRFWNKVDKSAGPDACWIWTASTSHNNGYGKIGVRIGGKRFTRAAHRVAFELANGVTLLPSTMILHSRECTSRLCCNPAHLRTGTQIENAQDARAIGVNFSKKLNPARACEVVQLRIDGVKARKIAKRFGMSVEGIRSVISGRTWAKHTAELRAELAEGKKTIKHSPRPGQQLELARAVLDR